MKQPNNPSKANTWLKTLRESKRISRTEMAHITSLSTYQIEGLEGQGVYYQLLRLCKYVKALGYTFEDILNALHSGGAESLQSHTRGNMKSPMSEVILQEGVRIRIFLDSITTYLADLELAPSSEVNRNLVPINETISCIIKEGTLEIKTIDGRKVYRRDDCFTLPSLLPCTFINCCGFSMLKMQVLANKMTPITPEKNKTFGKIAKKRAKFG